MNIVERFLEHCEPTGEPVTRAPECSLYVLTRQAMLYAEMAGSAEPVTQELLLDELLRRNYRIKDGYVDMRPSSVRRAFHELSKRVG